jgi:plasmid maintenance system antidote protein VapI
MFKQMQGVTTRQPLKGRAEVSPRLVVPAIGDSCFAVASVDATKIFNFLIAPVINVNIKSKLTQELRDEWDRIIKDVDFSKTTFGAKPIVVSARKNWKLYQGEINIIEAAYVIDGAKYIEYLNKNKISQPVSMIIIFDKNESEELIIRRQIGEGSTFSIHDIKNKVGTDAPRMIIGETWRDVKIVSDPFVIKTSMGYTAAINVIDIKTNSMHHIITGAKSISSELEIIRSKLGTLSNVYMKIRKQSSDSKSSYEIRT